MKISIVTISYNQARFLRECVDSVLGQDHDELQYVIVDAGSTDGSREIIEAYGARVTTIFEPDAGPADGLNKGFAVATGEVLGFVNSDDMLLPGALRSVARTFDTRPDFDVAVGCGYFIDISGRRQRRICPSRFTPWLYVHGAVTVFQQGTFFRRTLFQNVGGFNPENMIAWDGELLLDMALSGARFARINRDLALFRLRADSISGGGRHGAGSEAFRAYRDRVFLKATGRSRGKVDWALDGVARTAKLAFDPAYLVMRIGAASAARGRVSLKGNTMGEAR